MSEDPNSESDSDSEAEKLAEIAENPDYEDEEEMIEPVECDECGEEHPGVVYGTTSDGFEIRYRCPEFGRILSTSLV